MTKLIVGINTAEHLIKNVNKLAWRRARTLFLFIIKNSAVTEKES